jgi:hypothetical protein
MGVGRSEKILSEIAAGLKNIRTSNLGIFARTEVDQKYFMTNFGRGAY